SQELLLAVESSSPLLSVALFRGEELLGEEEVQAPASTGLPALTRLLLEQHRVDPAELAALAIGEGPGSYNGLRCGFAYLAGINLPRKPKPLKRAQVGSLAAMALGTASPRSRRGCILNARRQQFFYATFEVDGRDIRPLGEGLVGRLEEIPDLASESIAWASYEVEGFTAAFPRAASVGRLALKELSKTEPNRTTPWEPRYLRPPVAV
ncbi:MAG: tRNA (adenosine(37)-N6)-threonylcarbamoyltransferase complex dimerization subunit type 1 TsaB, partial [Verrucomicrobiae bacterium]|nr:tRNA (adenosine(37)-N6)-threonylcarbamoyltransferase complex dimerization subunit type 1 TsaB [Verrucomicrobiae bacterium]